MVLRHHLDSVSFNLDGLKSRDRIARDRIAREDGLIAEIGLPAFVLPLARIRLQLEPQWYRK